MSSVFYVWVYREPLPEETAKRRRIYGVVTNMIFSDFPVFLVEVQMVGSVGFVEGLQSTCFVVTCISLLYSGYRVFKHFTVKFDARQSMGEHHQGYQYGFDGGTHMRRPAQRHQF